MLRTPPAVTPEGRVPFVRVELGRKGRRGREEVDGEGERRLKGRRKDVEKGGGERLREREMRICG